MLLILKQTGIKKKKFRLNSSSLIHRLVGLDKKASVKIPILPVCSFVINNSKGSSQIIG
jgi:hypothetical protein